MAGHHVARGYADACLQLQTAQLLAQLARGLECHGVGIIDREWRAEDCQGGVTLELVDDALVAMHHLDDMLEELVELLHHFFRGVIDGEGGGPDDVDKQHGHLAILAAEFWAFFQSTLGHLGADIAAENIAHALALAQATHHLVEAGLENTELGTIVDIHLDIGLSSAHAVDGILQLDDGVYHAHHGEYGADESGSQGRDAQRDDGGDDIGGIVSEHPHLLAHVDQNDADERDSGSH